ncbi:hypothetical protein Agub_g3185, partial [Astrephomene gubernaculifera]
MPPRQLPKGRRIGASVATGPLYKVKQLADKVLLSGDATRLSLGEIDGATDEVIKWSCKADNSDGKTPGLWASLDSQELTRLHALYAFVLRRSSSSQYSDTERAAYAALRSKLSSELAKLVHDEGTHMPAGRVRAVMYTTLRAHVLRCLAALLAQAASPLAFSQPQQVRRSRRNLQAARDVLVESRQLLAFCHELLTSGEEGADDIVPQRMFISCLESELSASRLLEHWSRLLLLLSAAAGDRSDDAVKQLHQLTAPLLGLDDFIASTWRCQELLDNPSLSYLLSSHVVGLCAALDGGPTYGMPVDTLSADDDDDAQGAAKAAGPQAVAPLFGSTGLRLRRQAPEGAGTKLAQWVLSAWSDTLYLERSTELQHCNGMERALSPLDRVPRPSVTMSLRPLYRWMQQLSDRVTRDREPGGLLAAAEAAARLGTGAQPVAYRFDLDIAHAAGVRAQERYKLTVAPPLHAEATFELCIRLASAATKAIKLGSSPRLAASAAGPSCSSSSARSGRDRDRERGQGAAGLLVAAAEAPELAVRAIKCARQALGAEVMATKEALPPAVDARLRRWWAAVGELAEAAVVGGVPAGGVRWERLGDELAVPSPWSLKGLPTHPTPCVAAALAAGYASWIPGVIGAAHSALDGAWINYMVPLTAAGDCAWDQFFAFSPPGRFSSIIRKSAVKVSKVSLSEEGAISRSGRTDSAVSDLSARLDAAHKFYCRALDEFPALAAAAAEERAKAGGSGAAGAAAAAEANGGGGEGGDADRVWRIGAVLADVGRLLVPEVAAALLTRLVPATGDAFWMYRDGILRVATALLRWAALLAAAAHLETAAGAQRAAATGSAAGAQEGIVGAAGPGAAARGSATAAAAAGAAEGPYRRLLAG